MNIWQWLGLDRRATRRAASAGRTFPRFRPQLEILEDRSVPSALNPIYDVSFADANTSENEFVAQDGKHYWNVSAGADSYQNDVYERPTAQTYHVQTAAGSGQRFAAAEYLANLDIVQGKAGFDENYLYVSIKMAGLDKRTEDGNRVTEGLVYRYGFRIATQADGGGGLLVVADQPGLKNGTNFGSLGTFIYRDANGDVGGAGRDVTKQDQSGEVNGNGYERVVASDGRLANKTQVLWARVNPADATVVEFALDYRALGYTAADLRSLPYLEFEANKGLQDPANYAWNDEYTKSEAGSPYRAVSGDRSKSEFGTQGLGNIYELDTLRGGPIVKPAPAPSSLSGSVYVDFDRNGVRDGGDIGRGGVTIILKGIDDRGVAVWLETTTDLDGRYFFNDLRPGTYAIQEIQPFDRRLEDGHESVGTINGVVVGTQVTNDVIESITLGPGQHGIGYDFGEFQAE